MRIFVDQDDLSKCTCIFIIIPSLDYNWGEVFQLDLVRKQAKSWAAGIVHALGMINFFFDQSFEPAMRVPELWEAFGVSKSTGGNKSRAVRDLFDMYQFDPDWTLPSLMEKNNLAWLIQTPDGLVVDARTLPLELQLMLTEAGTIPERAGLFEALESGFRTVETEAAPPGTQCGLCGNIENLTRTPCCNQRICDDAARYWLHCVQN